MYIGRLFNIKSIIINHLNQEVEFETMIRKPLSKKTIITGSIVFLLILVLCVAMSLWKKYSDDLPMEQISEEMSANKSKDDLPIDDNNDTTSVDRNRDNSPIENIDEEMSVDKGEDALQNENNNEEMSADESKDALKDDKNNSDTIKDDKTTVEKKSNKVEAEGDFPKDLLNILCSTQWHEIGKYTYLAARFSTDGIVNIWDTVGNPCMKGDFVLNAENKTITLDCSEDEDFDPPFTIPKEATCSIYLTKEGYLCIQYQKNQMLFRMDKNVEENVQMMGYVWNASSASDGSDVTGLKLSLGKYFALYNKNTTYFASEHYSIGTKADYITVNWSGYGNDDSGEYLFMYSIIPYVDLEAWDLSDKRLSVDEASDTFEEDMKLQISYYLKEDTLELEYDGVTITFTRGKSSVEEDEVIFNKLTGN